jgi:hypothetical protein
VAASPRLSSHKTRITWLTLPELKKTNLAVNSSWRIQMKVWASTTRGLEAAAAAEVEQKISISGTVAKHHGQISFELAADVSEQTSARELCKLRTVEYLYVYLLQQKLQLECKCHECEKTAVSPVFGTAVGLDAIRDATAALPSADVRRCVSMCSLMAEELNGSQDLINKLAPHSKRLAQEQVPPPAPDEYTDCVSCRRSIPRLRFRAFGRRGGKHVFSSDDVKRIAASGLSQIPSLEYNEVQQRCSACAKADDSICSGWSSCTGSDNGGVADDDSSDVSFTWEGTLQSINSHDILLIAVLRHTSEGSFRKYDMEMLAQVHHDRWAATM